MLSGSALVCSAFLTQAQGTFRNLSFESANVSGYAPGFIPITNALPGWIGYIVYNEALEFQFDEVIYNSVSLGAAAITLQGPGSQLPILQGSYSVFLQPQFGSGFSVPAIAQAGTIPASAQSIRFYALGGAVYPLTFLTFAGQQIPVSLLNNTPNYSIYGGDVTAFANQPGELRFTGGGYLDNIFFSGQPIPEPGAGSLFAIGALLLGHLMREIAKS